MAEEAVTTITTLVIITVIIHPRLIIDHHLQLDRRIFEIIFEEEEVVAEDDLVVVEEAVIVIDTEIFRVDLPRFIVIFATNRKFTETLRSAVIVVHLHQLATERHHLEVQALEGLCVMVQAAENRLSVMEVLEVEMGLSVTDLINIMGEMVAHHPFPGVVSRLLIETFQWARALILESPEADPRIALEIHRLCQEVQTYSEILLLDKREEDEGLQISLQVTTEWTADLDMS